MYYFKVDTQRCPPLQTNEDCSPCSYADKVLWLTGLIPAYWAHWAQPSFPAGPAHKFPFGLWTLHCGDVTDFKITLLSLRKVQQLQNLYGIKILNTESYNWAHLQCEVTHQQSQRRLFYDGGQWEKCYLGIICCNVARWQSGFALSSFSYYIHDDDMFLCGQELSESLSLLLIFMVYKIWRMILRCPFSPFHSALIYSPFCVLPFFWAPVWGDGVACFLRAVYVLSVQMSSILSIKTLL